MIHEVDVVLRTLIEREIGTREVEIVFDAPTREWAGRRNSPTIDVYLYDIREDMRRRERGLINEYDDRNLHVVARHTPPRYFKLSYLITAWTQRPEDEHRLLAALLSTFLRFEALPQELLTGPLERLGLPVPVTVALPPPEDRAFADVWSALGGELKPSIDIVVSTPMDTGQRWEAATEVSRPPRVGIGGTGGWPAFERVGGKSADRLRGVALERAAERAAAEPDGDGKSAADKDKDAKDGRSTAKDPKDAKADESAPLPPGARRRSTTRRSGS